MNRNAVAMAADSAVTIMGDHGHVIYKSVDKVFELVPGEPVGVMIYNNAEIMGTPWETVISLYRREAGGKTFSTVEEYAQDFIQFLNVSQHLFPEEQQDLEYLRMVALLYGAIVRTFDAEVHASADNPHDQASGLFAHVVEQVHRLYLVQRDGSKRPDLPCFGGDLGERMRRKHKGEIDQIISSLEGYMKRTFPAFALSSTSRAQLHEMAAYVVTKDAFFEGYTGLVFAGFGARQQFPSMVSFFTSNVIGNRLKYTLDRTESLGAESGPAIHTFAQDRMVHTFISGIDPELRYQIFNETSKLAQFLIEDVVGSVKGASDTERRRVVQSYSQERLTGAMHAFYERIDAYQQRVHTQPVLQAIDVLPRMELAETAASLVKLNSFQLKVTGQPETVGGPIDVAIISHSEGLVMVEDSHTYA